MFLRTGGDSGTIGGEKDSGCLGSPDDEPEEEEDDSRPDGTGFIPGSPGGTPQSRIFGGDGLALTLESIFRLQSISICIYFGHY